MRSSPAFPGCPSKGRPLLANAKHAGQYFRIRISFTLPQHGEGPERGLGASEPSPEIKAQVLARDGDGCGRLSAAVPFTAGPRFRISFAPTESRCRRGSAVHSIGRFAYRREPLSTRTIDPVVCVRYVTQAITALATSSASTARFNGVAAGAAAIISAMRPRTNPVWHLRGAVA